MDEELFSTNAAAEFLNEQVPERSVTGWALWLRNNRNNSRRVVMRIPFERLGGGAFYRRDDLASYVAWEKSRQVGRLKLTGRAAEVMRAYGIGSASGSTTGRKLRVTAIDPKVDEASGMPYVQIITDDPLMVYRLEVLEAKSIAGELLEAIDVCERAAT